MMCQFGERSLEKKRLTALRQFKLGDNHGVLNLSTKLSRPLMWTSDSVRSPSITSPMQGFIISIHYWT